MFPYIMSTLIYQMFVYHSAIRYQAIVRSQLQYFCFCICHEWTFLATENLGRIKKRFPRSASRHHRKCHLGKPCVMDAIEE